MKDKTIISLTAIASIAILTGIALFKGIDGALYMSSMAIIGGIAGYTFKELKDKIT